MTETIIERDGDLPIRFIGELVAEVDSYTPGKLRWTALSAYRTSTGKYVLHEEGLTEVEGEGDRSSAIVSEDAGKFVVSLYKVNDAGRPYITRLAQDLLAEVAKVDDEVGAAGFVEV